MKFLKLFTKYDSYKIAIFLSSLSLAFGLLREFITVGLLGFTATNDLLQIYLSVIYTISLMIDAIRLACLNLFPLLSLPRIIFSASLVSLPASIIIGLILNFSTVGMNEWVLAITILGGYFHLIACLLITYKQRNGVFLSAQIINVMPNSILIPGIILGFFFFRQYMVINIVVLTSVIPIIQCILLLLLPNKIQPAAIQNKISLTSSVLIFFRHFSTTIGEQLFQIIYRAAFFNYGAGYLSFFSIAVRSYSAMRFILIDSYIGAKLSEWKKELNSSEFFFGKLINSNYLILLMLFLPLLITQNSGNHLFEYSIKISMLLIFSFYFSTLVRIIYFKINHLESNAQLVIQFALYEIGFALFAFILLKQLNDPILILLWLGYIAKPFGQLLFLRKRLGQLLIN